MKYKTKEIKALIKRYDKGYPKTQAGSKASKAVIEKFIAELKAIGGYEVLVTGTRLYDIHFENQYIVFGVTESHRRYYFCGQDISWGIFRYHCDGALTMFKPFSKSDQKKYENAQKVISELRSKYKVQI